LGLLFEITGLKSVLLKIERVVFTEGCEYPLIGNIGEVPMVESVFHVPVPFGVVGMQQGVVFSVEMERFNAKTPA
jgi:hypothetical protein